MKKARVFSGLLAVLMIIGLCACSNDNTNSVSSSPENTSTADESGGSAEIPTIRFAHFYSGSNEQKAKISEAIDEYAESVKDEYVLVQEITAGDELRSKIRIDVSSDNLPDVFWFWGSQSDLSSLVDSNLVLNVDEYFAKSEEVRKEDYNAWAWDLVTIDGSQYCIPTEGTTGAWFCNKEIFEEYNVDFPETFDDVIALADTFSPNGIVTLATGSKGGNPSHQLVDMIYTQYEGATEELKSLPETGKIDTPNLKSALDLIDQMRQAGCFPSDTVANGDWGTNFALYNEGKAAMIPCFGWQLSEIKPEIEEATVITDIPTVTGGSVDQSKVAMVGGSAGMVINQKSFNDPVKQAAVIDVVDMFCSDEMTQLRFDVWGEVPNKIMDLDTSHVSPKILNDIMEYNEGRDAYLTHMVSIPDANIWVDYQNYLDEFFSGAISSDEFLSKAQASMEKNKS